MNELEEAVRRTLSARVSHLTDEQLDADVSVPEPLRRTWRRIALPLAAVAAVTVSVVLGVSGDKPRPAATPPGPALVGTTWQLDSTRRDGQLYPVPTDVGPAIRFDGKGAMSGSDGCNSFDGSAAIHGPAIRITPTGGTLMYCPTVWFNTAIRSIDHWAISGGKLRLTGDDGTAMTFHAG